MICVIMGVYFVLKSLTLLFFAATRFGCLTTNLNFYTKCPMTKNNYTYKEIVQNLLHKKISSTAHHSFLINCEINPIYTIKITAAFEDMILIGSFVISIHISMEIESVALILYMIIFRIIYGTYVLDRLFCY